MEARSGILEVAHMAGVSPATVSRVINGTATVSKAKRELVETAIRTLNYEPNKFARSLILKRSNIIGVIIDRSIRYATANVLVQLEEYAASCGYMSMVMTVDEPFESEMRNTLAQYKSVSVDGLIVIAPRQGLSQQVVESNVDVPTVIVSSQLEDIGIPVVGEDQYQGACKLVELLIKMGHRCIWHIAGEMSWYDEQRRRQGYLDVLHEHGLSGASHVVETGSWSPNKAYEAVMRMDAGSMPDALFVASDHMAMAVISALAVRGIRVPEDISVVGYDDAESSAFLFPPLTTVKQDLPSVARQAVELLIKSIEGESISMVTAMEPELICRSSVRQR